MPKSRTQLIMEIRQARKDAKANLLYVKGLTKMKKEDLKNIYDELSHIDKRRAQYGETLPEREMVDIERQEDLEEELDKIKKELNDLEDEEEKLEAKKGKYSVLGNHDYGEYAHWKNDDEKVLNLSINFRFHDVFNLIIS